MSKKNNPNGITKVTFKPLGGKMYRCNLCKTGREGRLTKSKLDGHRKNCPNLKGS